jgi:membrane fusion protein, multidrug efflux system
MLKITTARETRRLVLEGSLSGPWVDTLGHVWREALARHDAQQIVVDLSEVTFVDSRAKALLTEIHKAGATLSAPRCMNAELIREITSGTSAGEENERPSKAFVWLIAGLIPALFALTACSTVRAGEAPPAEGRPPVAVTVSAVTAGTVSETVDVIGALSPKYAADVKSEVSGTVAAVYVTEWVPVRAGARLARLNTAENDAALDAIRAGEAQTRVAEARARREHERAQRLKEYGLITPQAVDDARSAMEAAAAATAAAQGQVRAAEARLAKSFITAPMDGVIALRGVNVGDRVENMGGGGPMFRIVDNRLLDLTVWVPSVQLGAVRVGQPLEFTVDAVPGRAFTGTVMFINPAVDEGSRAAKVIAEVRNADNALKGGLFATGHIVVANRTGLMQIPRAALLNWNVSGATADVFVVRNGTAEKRPVRTAGILQAAGSAVAIEHGLAIGDRVVTRGGFALKAGDRVTVSGEGM